ncbi:MAG: ATP-binding protein [bacterium]|nr:ATP-binding protein [bacterium]MDE0601974.1 ATP-binding protein [bacterium]
MSAASLHINESLDFDTVLQGVLDSARTLTDARHGVLTLLGDAGDVTNHLSSGMSPDESRRLWDVPNGHRFIDYLGEVQSPIRVADLQDYLRSLGLGDMPLPVEGGSFLAAPITHRGEHVGHIFLANRERGEEFTVEDEEVLVMFAAQAALVISNSHRHMEEQRARADLEALVNTSPIGVVVLNARTGQVVSRNQEARRIVGDLRLQDGSVDHLMEVVTIRRADGREVSLQEMPMAQVLASGETVRAEEMVIEVPDGRKITTLVNATPIRSEQGDVVSVVVTMQDITPVEELQKLRAEFLGMVSHELRTPLTTIKGSAATVLGSSSPLDIAETRQFFRIVDEQADHMRDLIANLLDVSRIATGSLSVHREPVDVGSLLDQARAGFLSGGGRNLVSIDVSRDLPPVMADRQRLLQVIGNLLSNAAKYSPDRSSVLMKASLDDQHVVISVTDQGRGIAAEHLPYLFRKFSRLHGASAESRSVGDGLGLAICKGIVEAHGGRIWATSTGPGMGARFTFSLPVVEEGASPMMMDSSRFLPGSAGLAEQRRVLVVDDDLQILRYVRDTLSEAGYVPIITGDPNEVGHLMRRNKPHLVLLDFMLLDTDGVTLMKDLPELAEVPVIFLSGYGEDEIVASALDAGAADYVVKPFSPTELIVRIGAALRPPRAPGDFGHPKHFRVGDLAINYLERTVTVEGRPVKLTATEYKLLTTLSLNADRAMSQDQLLKSIWGVEQAGDPRVLRSFVKNLRRKLGDEATNPTYILTERGFGYRIAKPQPAH